jgi:hypothetical protein
MYECVAIDSSTPFMQALGSVCVQAYLLINLMETQLDARSATVTAFEAGNHQLDRSSATIRAFMQTTI